MIFIDFHWYMHICQTTHNRSRCLGGMTSCDAAECFAEAPGHLGARPDRMWGPAQASTPSNRISHFGKFHDFQDLVLHHTYIIHHTYTVTSKNLRTMCYLCLTFRKCARGRDKVRVLTQHFNSTGSESTEIVIFINFHWFSNDFHWFPLIYAYLPNYTQ